MVYKNTLKKIKKSFGRYLSLMIIVLLGVGFYEGISQTSYDITSSVSEYANSQKLMDIEVVSTTGFGEEDINSLRNLLGVKNAVEAYSADILVDNGDSLRVHSILKTMNKPEIIEGENPQNSGECMADYRHYKVGDTINVIEDKNDALKHKKYKVTATVKSPLYMAVDYGSTTVGDGSLDSYIYVEKEEFDLESCTEICITVKNAGKYNGYSEKYKKKVDGVLDDIEEIKEDRQQLRDDYLIDEFEKKLYSEVDPAISTVFDYSAFDEPIAEFEESVNTKWLISDRDDCIAGYDGIGNGTNVITLVSNVIPVFFIIIVILMSSNSMARMIVEERGELGCLASLGFSDFKIITSYLIYVLSATIFGNVLGFFIGSRTIPDIIYGTFSFYLLPKLILTYSKTHFYAMFIVSIIIMSSVTVFFTNMELKNTPASLLRPLPPKKGQKIFLERLSFIWSRLSFSWKVTIRNIVRYKQRGIMTLIGVAGCCALIVTGFGLRDSTLKVVDRQFGGILKYDVMAVLTKEKDEISDDLKEVFDKEGLKNPVLIEQSSYKASNNIKSMETYLISTKNLKQFNHFFEFVDISSGKKLKLGKDSVFITKKMANDLNVRVGKNITLKNSYGEKYEFKVDHIVENYIENYIYIGNHIYDDKFSEKIKGNMVIADFDGDYNELAKKLLEEDDIVNVNFMSDLLKTAKDTNVSLDKVIILIVVVGILLVIVVIYNLTSINISERKREIATLKVLGFTDNESNSYIYRETFVTALVSIIIGLFTGRIFFGLVMDVIESEAMTFFRIITVKSYVISALIILFVNFIMQVFTYMRMKKINMVESLKSVE
ncbi:putative ABC transport system permease protein [Acetitomaculum ruminis DSM 5522]|uniref:Putative ABC transport system permease protein n=1 Tax=Acetitomaculum ruminis DSM 5522 TaxID=1120918 RepID=A0A1I1A469_9FIRM|nr:ABC transporter permease [Acetitomaculum ruminis]SFB32727.1 putative ABC transport system permease protein [Acetitomaculum ruminis DSM 5522]